MNIIKLQREMDDKCKRYFYRSIETSKIDIKDCINNTSVTTHYLFYKGGIINNKSKIKKIKNKISKCIFEMVAVFKNSYSGIYIRHSPECEIFKDYKSGKYIFIVRSRFSIGDILEEKNVQ